MRRDATSPREKLRLLKRKKDWKLIEKKILRAREDWKKAMVTATVLVENWERFFQNEREGMRPLKSAVASMRRAL